MSWTMKAICPVHLSRGAVQRGQVHQCPTCHISLLTGEKPGFCYGMKGSHYTKVPPLPPLPEEYHSMIDHPELSSLSHILNLIFSFASLETTHPFPSVSGVPSFFAIQGKTYHRLQPTYPNSAIKWLLYDSFMPHKHPYEEWATCLPP
jgi:hypothetical protein